MLKDKILRQLMSTKSFLLHINAREEHFTSWRMQQFSHPNFPIAGINEMLKEARVKALTKYDFGVTRSGLKLQIEDLGTEISQNKLEIGEKRAEKYEKTKERDKMLCNIHNILKIVSDL